MLQITPISNEKRDEWIRRVKIGAIAYAGIVVLAGVIFFIALLVGGAYGRAFLGLLAMAGGVALAALVWGACHVARTMIESLEALDGLRERIDMLESTVELHSAQAGLSATLVDDLSALVAGKLEEARFPRIVSSNEEPEPDVEEREVGTEVVAEEAEEEVLVSRDPSILRGEFSELVRSQRYADALQTGEKIAALYPESRMAADFAGLRSHLEHRVAKQVARSKIGL